MQLVYGEEEFRRQLRENTSKDFVIWGDGKYASVSDGSFYSFIGGHLKELKPQFNNTTGYGRIFVKTGNDDKYHWVFCHQSIAQNFLTKPLTEEPLDIHHKDFCKENNSVDNLVYLPRSVHRHIHALHREKQSTDDFAEDIDTDVIS